MKIFVTRKFHSLTVDDEVRQLLSNLSTFLFVLWKVELLAQFHVKHLPTVGKQKSMDVLHVTHFNV